MISAFSVSMISLARASLPFSDVKMIFLNSTSLSSGVLAASDMADKHASHVERALETKELKKKILKTAKIYEVQKKDKNFKPYETTSLEN